MTPQDTASLTVLPTSTAAQAYPAPQDAVRRNASHTTPMRTSCSMSCATAFGSTRRRARKHPRSAPATAMTGRLGARIFSPSAPRTSCSTQRAKGSARASWAAMATNPSAPAVTTSPETVRAMLRPRARLWAARRVEATFMPDDARDTNTIYTDRMS